MAVLASDILAAAAILLDEPTVDADREVFFDAILLPFLQDAFEDFLLDLELHGVPILNELSSAITIPIGQTKIADGFGMPTDFIDPIYLKERPTGSSNSFVDVHERDWEPQITPTNTLRYWAYREGEIKLVGATQSIDVLLYYVKDLTISGVNTPITIRRAKPILAPKVAQLAAQHVGENKQLADANMLKYGTALNKFLTIQVNKLQSLPVRRPGFRSRRGIRRWPQP